MNDPAALPGIGWQSLALSLASLGVVCLVAWGALRLLAGRGFGKASGAVKILARCPLEPRRSVYVIEAAGRCLLIGVGDGPMTVLAELEASKLPRADLGRVAGPRFAEILARAMRPGVAGPVGKVQGSGIPGGPPGANPTSMGGAVAVGTATSGDVRPEGTS